MFIVLILSYIFLGCPTFGGALPFFAVITYGYPVPDSMPASGNPINLAWDFTELVWKSQEVSLPLCGSQVPSRQKARQGHKNGETHFPGAQVRDFPILNVWLELGAEFPIRQGQGWGNSY